LSLLLAAADFADAGTPNGPAVALTAPEAAPLAFAPPKEGNAGSPLRAAGGGLLKNAACSMEGGDMLVSGSSMPKKSASANDAGGCETKSEEDSSRSSPDVGASDSRAGGGSDWNGCIKSPAGPRNSSRLAIGCHSAMPSRHTRDESVISPRLRHETTSFVVNSRSSSSEKLTSQRSS
jgi:hypothetical protein